MSYPLYIAAILVGLTQPIPGLENLTNLQKDFFHYWIGVPEKVLTLSEHFITQILSRSNSKEELNREINELLNDEWIEKLGRFADTLYYRIQLGNIQIENDSDIKEVLSGSIREKRIVIESVVLSAAIASARNGGGKVLSQLAGILRVEMPSPPHAPWGIGGGILMFLFVLTGVWFLVLLIDYHVDVILGPVNLDLGPRKYDFWPNNLPDSGFYVASQMIPIFLSIMFVVKSFRPEKYRSQNLANNQINIMETF